MGFDPQRGRVERKTDIWFVATALAITAALLAWALLG